MATRFAFDKKAADQAGSQDLSNLLLVWSTTIVAIVNRYGDFPSTLKALHVLFSF
ncbi:MAG: hypothetical protein ACOX6N_03425 [Patescibacteria group bacterium]